MVHAFREVQNCCNLTSHPSKDEKAYMPPTRRAHKTETCNVHKSNLDCPFRRTARCRGRGFGDGPSSNGNRSRVCPPARLPRRQATGTSGHLTPARFPRSQTVNRKASQFEECAVAELLIVPADELAAKYGPWGPHLILSRWGPIGHVILQLVVVRAVRRQPRPRFPEAQSRRPVNAALASMFPRDRRNQGKSPKTAACLH
jgi:hypothetical protein